MSSREEQSPTEGLTIGEISSHPDLHRPQTTGTFNPATATSKARLTTRPGHGT